MSRFPSIAHRAHNREFALSREFILRRSLFDGKCPYESWLFLVNKRHFPPAKYSDSGKSGETEVPSIGTFFVIHSSLPRGGGPTTTS